MLAAILSLDSFYLDTFYLDTFAAAGFYLYIFVVAGFYLVTFAVTAFYLVTFAVAGFYLITFAVVAFYLVIFAVAAFYLDTFAVAGCREAVHRVILKILRCTKRLPPISALHFTILNIALGFFLSEKIRPWRILTDGFRDCGF